MKALVIFYSKSGNTERAALAVQEELKGANWEVDLVRIEVLRERGFLGSVLLSLVGAPVDVKDLPFDLTRFDTVYLGSPVWAFAPVPAINGYIQRCKGLARKPVAVFMTSHGHGDFHAKRILAKRLKEKGARVVGALILRQKELQVREVLQMKVKDFVRVSCLDFIGSIW